MRGKSLQAVTILAALAMVYILFLMPGAAAQGATAGFQKVGSNVTATTYTDTQCVKGATCGYYVTAVDAAGTESAPSSTIAVQNTGSVGNIALTWSVGTCPTGKTCSTPVAYNVYAHYAPVPPVGLAGATN